MPYITTRDQQSLFVRVIGRGQPVLVLSGLGMVSTHWLPFLLPHLHRFKFYIPDYRGFGGSANTPFLGRRDIFASHMQDVEDVVAHFQLKDFLLVGYSLGASTSMHWMQYGNFAQHHVKHYLHIDQTPCIHHRLDWPYGLLGQQQTAFMDSLHQVLALIEHNPEITELHALPRSDKQTLLHIWGNTLASMLGKNVPKMMLRLAVFQPHILRMLVPFSNTTYLHTYLQSYIQQKYDYRPAISKLKVPITFFMGQQSLLYAIEGQQIVAQSVAQQRSVVFENSGHAPLFNEPRKFMKEFGVFLNQAV